MRIAIAFVYTVPLAVGVLFGLDSRLDGIDTVVCRDLPWLTTPRSPTSLIASVLPPEKTDGILPLQKEEKYLVLFEPIKGWTAAYRGTSRSPTHLRFDF